MNVNDPLPENERDINEAGIVSVNSRGAAGGNVLGKVFFVSGVFGLLLVAGFYGYNRYRESQAATASAAKQTSKNESKPAAAGIARDFDKEQAAADAAVSKANLEQIGTLKSYEELRAPFSGTVTARYSDPGALIQNAATSQASALPLVEISETSRLRIYVYVDQAHAPFVRNGDAVTILDQANPSLKVVARVTRTSGAIDPKTRTLLVEIDVDNPHNRILAGSFVQVELKVQTPRYVEVPSDALIIRGTQTFVAVVTPDNTIKFTQVAVAEQTGETARLFSGLEEGERVARSVGERVPEGGKVQPVARPGS